MIKLIVWKFDQYSYIGYGDTLLDCIYDLSKETIKEGILTEIYDYYSNNDDFIVDEDDEEFNLFIEELSNAKISDRIYSWCSRDNYKYHIEED